MVELAECRQELAQGTLSETLHMTCAFRKLENATSFSTFRRLHADGGHFTKRNTKRFSDLEPLRIAKRKTA